MSQACLPWNTTAYQSLAISGRVVMTFSCTGLIVSNFMSFNAASSAGSTFPFRVLNDVPPEDIDTAGVVDMLTVCLLGRPRKGRMECGEFVAATRRCNNGLRTKRAANLVIPPIPRCTVCVDEATTLPKHCDSSCTMKSFA